MIIMVKFINSTDKRSSIRHVGKDVKSDSSILLFIKSPEQGRVKSRLALAVDEETALQVYKSFVLDITDTLKERGQPLTICFHPWNSKETVQSWLGKDLSYAPQRGEDLGERMENAFKDSFSEDVEKVVLIGSDIPDLTATMMDEAFSPLELQDAVIGPASDGGYYLIGFRKHAFLPEVFRGIPWSTGSVFQQTMEIFLRSGMRVHVLPEWNDVDTLSDLRALFVRNMDTWFAKSRSMSLCRKIFAGEDRF